MGFDDNAVAPDRDDFDGDGLGPDAPTVEPSADADPVAELLDEDLLEADLGEFDALLDDDEFEDIDEQLLDADEEEDEDDLELALLQDLGIDLDALDPAEPGLDDLAVGLDDDSVDDEVAA